MTSSINDGINHRIYDVNSILMIGQSNMAGRGDFFEVDEIKNDLCLMLRNGRWQPMSEPINPDRAVFSYAFHSGTCLAASFADEFAKFYKQKIGLIPCADGGTTLSQWMPGEILYEHAVMQSKLAMRTSNICGIIWHQGESDCHDIKNITTYVERLKYMVSSLRADIGKPDLPIVIGELSENIDFNKWNLPKENIVKFNETLKNAEKEIPNCILVKAKELPLKSDGIHFNSNSLRILGQRYFERYKKLTPQVTFVK